MNPIKLTETDKVIANILTVATGAIVIQAGFSFRDMFETFYGENPDLPFITKVALKSHIWAPLTLGLALIAFHRAAKRKPDSKRPFFLLLCLEMVIVAIILYGFLLPPWHPTVEMKREDVRTERATAPPK